MRRRVPGSIRLGTGQFGDPLGLEEAFPLNRYLLEHTRDLDHFVLEIKTKSARVDLLPDVANADNVVIAFSLNPPDIIAAVEHGTASLDERLSAAHRAVERGFRVSFHFDPILPVPGWQDAYAEVIGRLRGFRPTAIAWFSMGTFRFPVGFPERVRERHPHTTLFQEEFHPSLDGKIRMFRPFREQMYRHVKTSIERLLGDIHLYLCMESPFVWERLWGGEWSSARLKRYLDESVR